MIKYKLQKSTPIIYNVYAMQRSGHHGFIYWFMYQLSQKHKTKIFYNNTTQKIHTGEYASYDFFTPIQPDHQVINGNIYIFSKERDIYYQHNHGYEELKNIIFLRDFYNNIASIINNKNTYKNFKKNRKAWNTYAKEFMGLNNEVHNKYCIRYDKWHLDINYRKKISQDLNVVFSDLYKNKTSPHGRGSSFGQDVLDKNYCPNERYKLVLESKKRDLYKSIIKSNPEAVELNQYIFGFKLDI